MLGAPCVAQRVWPIPSVPGMVAPSWVSSLNAFSLPTDLVIWIFSPSNTAIPAESYPRYSSLARPSRMMGAA